MLPSRAQKSGEGRKKKPRGLFTRASALFSMALH